MLDKPQTDTLQVELLAHEIVARLQDTEPGHCARVDFLDRAESLHICRYIMQQQLAPRVVFNILDSNEAHTKSDPIFITTDKAIELPNRKQAPLCLFIPSHLIVAPYSSIANSFALIAGPALNALVLYIVRVHL